MQQNQHMKQQDIMMQQLGINTTNDINTQNQQDLIQQLGLNKPSEPQVQQNQNQLNQELMMQQLGLNNNTPMNSESQQSQDLMMQQMLNTPRNQESQQSQDLMMQQMLNNSQSTTPVLKTEPVNSTGTPQFSSAISPPQQHQTIPNNQQFLKQVDASGNTAQFNTKNQAFPNQFNSFDTHVNSLPSLTIQTSKSSENYSPPNSAAMEPSPKPPVQVIASPAMTDSNFSFTNSKDIEILQKKVCFFYEKLILVE
ncbi:hypothetical protein BC833DRAFT_51694 [Globomyces pollinis-pini]|nr:hypothetical protein BC833DRAFT_51694 [Globomyces pollinis-pini]